MIISRSTISLLRIPFSIFLSPLYFFSLSLVDHVDWFRALLIFVILHFMVYPASNGYNSMMDRDTDSIGGLEKPPQPSADLFVVTIILDLLAIAAGFFVSLLFGLLMPLYIGASKAYSYRRIRLKRFPVIGYLTVIIFQGAFTFWLVYYGSSIEKIISPPWQPVLIATLLIGGFYPLTQIYQHQQDLKDGVKTISYKLGYRGTFIFCGTLYIAAWLIMAQFFMSSKQTDNFFVSSIFFLPVIVYYSWWFRQVIKDQRAASFRNTMRMNWIASVCTNIAFIILLIWRWF